MGQIKVGNLEPDKGIQKAIEKAEISIPKNLMFDAESTEFKPETKPVTSSGVRRLTVEEAKLFDDEMNRFIDTVLIAGIDYGIIPNCKKPTLLKSRLDAKEKQNEQSVIVKLSGLMFVVGFIIAGLDFRFGWSKLPFGVSVAAVVIFVFAYIIYAEVLRENTYLSRTIKVEENQKVIDTGLYSLVRHPMYSATILLFLSMPLILGSLYSFMVFLIYSLSSYTEPRSTGLHSRRGYFSIR